MKKQHNYFASCIGRNHAKHRGLESIIWKRTQSILHRSIAITYQPPVLAPSILFARPFLRSRTSIHTTKITYFRVFLQTDLRRRNNNKNSDTNINALPPAMLILIELCKRGVSKMCNRKEQLHQILRPLLPLNDRRRNSARGKKKTPADSEDSLRDAPMHLHKMPTNFCQCTTPNHISERGQ